MLRHAHVLQALPCADKIEKLFKIALSKCRKLSARDKRRRNARIKTVRQKNDGTPAVFALKMSAYSFAC